MVQGKLKWATVHFGVESRYNVLYRDRQGWGGSAVGAHGQARHGHDTATTQPRYGQEAHDTAGPRSMACGSTRSRGLAGGVCHNTIICILTAGTGLASQHGELGVAIRRSSALRHGTGALQHARQLARHGARQGLSRDTFFLYRDRRG